MAVDQRKWRIITNAGLLRFEPLNDAENYTFDVIVSIDRACSIVASGNISTSASLYSTYHILASNGTIRSQGPRGTPPGSGGGIELFFQSGLGYLHCYDITTGGYPPIIIAGGSVDIQCALTVGGITGSAHIQSAAHMACSTLYTRNGTFVMPGRVDVADGGIQGSWYLGSHPAYGLYSNTGLYLAGGLTVAGGASFGGSLTFPANVWHLSSDGIQRLYFGWGSHTYIKSYANIYFRGGNTDTEILTIFAGGEVQTPGGVKAMAFGCKPGMYAAPTGSWFNFNWTGNVQVWIDATYVGDIVFSDSRLKRDFTPLTSSLDKVLKMRPGSFYFRDGVDAAPRLRLGLQAQDLVEVAPELVRQTDLPTELTPDGTYQIDYTGMIPMLVASIQELEQRVSKLE
jgi:hypothetical protein